MAQSTVRTETILDQLVAGKRELLAARMSAEPIATIRERSLASRIPLPLAPTLLSKHVGLIAEIKRASPTAGLLDGNFDPVERARSYVSGGAAAISILTEERRFLGKLEDVTLVRSALASDERASSLPLLRKDFLFDPYHLHEARAAGADAILLIVAVLEQGALNDLVMLATQLGLTALVEVHDEFELERALEAGATLIGVNNRDLRTFVTSLEVTERLSPLIPRDVVVVSESGVKGRGDVERLANVGIDAVLVGEALMRSGEVSAATRGLTGVPRQPRDPRPNTLAGATDVPSKQAVRLRDSK